MRALLAAAQGEQLLGETDAIDLAAAARQTRLGGAADDLAGRSVLVRTANPLAAALALIELDGLASRLVLAPPDLSERRLEFVVERAAIAAIVSDGAGPPRPPARWLRLGAPTAATASPASMATEWVMFTSGSTGAPKMVIHTLAGLLGAIPRGGANGRVWASFYDVRRYGGLQILLRALVSGGSMVVAGAAEPAPRLIGRMAAAGASHISGTPSHWRRALMSREAAALAPAAVRLSGEIADQAILDALGRRFPAASLAHAFASTEAGVCFEVSDRRAGFPAALVDAPGEVELRIADGTLRVRSMRTARGYVGDGSRLADDEGFVDTGDRVAIVGERAFFGGRASGVVNVGGFKVAPEEVEAVINAHPGVAACRVFARPSPLTGQLVAAEVVARARPSGQSTLRAEILALCRDRLTRHKVPASLGFVDDLPLSPGGKLARSA